MITTILNDYRITKYNIYYKRKPTKYLDMLQVSLPPYYDAAVSKKGHFNCVSLLHPS